MAPKTTPLMSGVLLIDKPVGPTSHDVVAAVRPQLGIRRVGHSGTLDPLASGLLIVGVGSAARLLDYTHELPKTYTTTLYLGATSTTDDAGGTITTVVDAIPPTREAIEKTLHQFTGTLSQVPPRYAAIKKQGKKLYEYGREGEVVVAPPRKVTIYSLTLDAYAYPQLTLTVQCSGGTYIRALGRDIGAALGCGAYVEALRRTQIGSFSVDRAQAVDKITSETLHDYLLPLDILVAHLARVTLTNEQTHALHQGQAIDLTLDASDGSLVTLYAHAGNLFGLGSFDQKLKRLYPKKILYAGN